VTFSIQKCGFLSKVKAIKRLWGGILRYAAQVIPPIEAERAKRPLMDGD
jgi:hypothetical protein